jgi:hypothetical protein
MLCGLLLLMLLLPARLQQIWQVLDLAQQLLLQHQDWCIPLTIWLCTAWLTCAQATRRYGTTG